MQTNTEEEKDIEEYKEINIDEINTVYAIKDGMFEIVDKTEISKKNYFYRVHSKVPGIIVIDYDKTNVVPIVKDILNRQNTFIEIKYLRWVIGIQILLFLGLIVIGILIPLGKQDFGIPKSEIITEIKKGVQIIQQGMNTNTPINIPLNRQNNYSPTSTESSGYNPITPENVTENTHKNIPKYAN